MKKAFDQTVRDLKREVNKKVLKIPGIEQKILDATSNEPWGPHGSHLADIAQATRNFHEYQIIMHVIWKRINDTGKNWRHVYKALIVLEYLVANGSERVIDEIREHAYQISTLSDFQYIDSSGKDQGSNVRRKSQSLVALVNDKERIQEVRQKALANRDKYRGTFSTGGAYRPSSYSSTGGYGDRYDEGRYGGRDEDRNGYGREREWGYRDDDRYGRSGDPYGQEGDRYGRDFDDRYGRGNYRDDDYRGSRSNDDYQYGSRNRSFDRERDRSFDDDDRYSSRTGGGRADDPSQDERRFEHKLSEQNVGAPPNYEEVTKDDQPQMQEERNGGNVAAAAPKASPPSVPKESSPTESTSQSLDNTVPGVPVSTESNDVDGFDEFDPRGSVSATLPPASSLEMDLFGSLPASDPINSLALVPVASTTTVTPEANVPTNLDFGTNFVALSSASTVSSQPNEDPFGEPPFKATQENFSSQQQKFAPVASVQLPSSSTRDAEPSLPVAPKIETAASFDFGDSFGGITYTPSVANGQPPFVSPPNLVPAVPAGSNFPGTLPPQTGTAAFIPSQATIPAAPTSIQTTHSNLLALSMPPALIASQATPVTAQAAQPTVPTNIQVGPHMNLLSQSGLSSPPLGATPTVALPPVKTQPSKEKFETKSTVWADTLSRGLVDLNISGPKINPHADIGIDFDSINRKEKRKEEKKSTASPATSTIAMGKAMGAGSGIGRAGASGLPPPPNSMMGSSMGGGGGTGMGMGIGGYGGSMNQPMGMGMGMNMGVSMGMGMPMRPPTGMAPPGPGMPGVGYNQMMGMGSYGLQQPYGGGYRY